MNLTKPYHCLVAGQEFYLDSKPHVLSYVLQLWRKQFFFFLKKAIFEIKYQSNLYIADENESL